MDTNNQKMFSLNGCDRARIVHVFSRIFQCQNITLLTHKNPDFDGMGACAAFAHILQTLGKNVEVIYPNEPGTPIPYLTPKALFNEHKQIPEIIVALDVANMERLYFPPAFANIEFVNIDHHVSNSIHATHNFVDGACSSAAEMLFVMLWIYDKALITRQVAEAILCGIFYDTLVLRTSSTTEQTLRVVEYLKATGLVWTDVVKSVIKPLASRDFLLWGELMSRIQISDSGKVAWIGVRESELVERNFEKRSLDGFVNNMAQMIDIDITFFAFEMADVTTKISLRSKKADVNAIAQQLGGGGHVRAAGLLIRSELDEAMRELVDVIEAS